MAKMTRKQKERYQRIGASMRAMDRQAAAFNRAVDAGEIVLRDGRGMPVSSCNRATGNTLRADVSPRVEGEGGGIGSSADSSNAGELGAGQG
jgi:hypothetical protein